MTVNINDLVQRQAAIVAEIDSVGGEELEFLASRLLPEHADAAQAGEARRFLRGLLLRRTGPLQGTKDVALKKPGVVAALPGFYVVSVMPLSDGSYDREHVLREPIIGWRVDSANYAVPLIAGSPVSDRWAILAPNNLVFVDENSNPFGEPPLALRDWIRSEIEWLEGPSQDVLAFEYPTKCAHVFEYGGPLAEAFGLMMARRRDWTGTLKELHETLSKLHDGTFGEMEGWPEDLHTFEAALEALEPKLAVADLFIGRTDDGRLHIFRPSGENAGGGSSSSALQ